MSTESIQIRFSFSQHHCPHVVAAFDGGQITSDACLLLSREKDRQSNLLPSLAASLGDRRDPRRAEESVGALVREP